VARHLRQQLQDCALAVAVCCLVRTAAAQCGIQQQQQQQCSVHSSSSAVCTAAAVQCAQQRARWLHCTERVTVAVKVQAVVVEVRMSFGTTAGASSSSDSSSSSGDSECNTAVPAKHCSVCTHALAYRAQGNNSSV
jgi:hypothetical protein